MLARFRDEMHGPSSARRHNNHVYGEITRPDPNRFSGDAQSKLLLESNYGSCFGDQRWGETDERMASAISWLIVANARLCAAATAP